jgi:hypothetical protein
VLLTGEDGRTRWAGRAHRGGEGGAVDPAWGGSVIAGALGPYPFSAQADAAFTGGGRRPARHCQTSSRTWEVGGSRGQELHCKMLTPPRVSRKESEWRDSHSLESMFPGVDSCVWSGNGLGEEARHRLEYNPDQEQRGLGEGRADGLFQA